jgi:uncharacterized metal-binding protein
VAIVSFVGVIAGMYVLTWTFMQDSRWQPVRWWWMLFPAAALSLLFAQASAPVVGLMRRLLVLVIAGWLVLAAARILTSVARHGQTPPVSLTEPSIRWATTEARQASSVVSPPRATDETGNVPARPRTKRR